MELYLDKLNKEVLEDKWINSIVKKGSYCSMCGSIIDPLLMEDHHIAGRKNDPFTIPVCPTCHRKMSIKQYSWDNQWTDDQKDTRITLGFVLQGIGEVLVSIGRWLLEWAKKLLGGESEWNL
jgi:hypothetical protein